METKVLTPKGFKLIGDLTVGSQVCNPDGTVSRVIAVHDQGEQDFYRVTLLDGSSVEASAGHLWVVSMTSGRKRRKLPVPTVPREIRHEDSWNMRLMQRCSIVTTSTLAKLVARGQRDAAHGFTPRYFQLPLTAPVAFTAAPGRWPTFPPYTLGVLLGDGALAAGTVQFCTADEAIAERVRQELDGLFSVKSYNRQDHCPTYCITGPVGVKLNSPQNYLRRDGLFGCRSYDKFIPDRIKLAPVAIREAFIQGLFDTDGSMDERGHVDFTTVSERLACDVQWVLRSLGCRATITTKQPTYTHQGERRSGRLAYRLYVQGEALNRLFFLPRKSERVRAFNGGEVWPSHRIVSVEPSGRDKARCITIDHPNGLYLTDDFIVTHNSSALLMGALQYVQVPGYSALILRRHYTDLSLSGALMDRARAWLQGTGARWSPVEHTWTFPAGSSVSFGYLSTEDDKYRYRSAEYQAIFFDELTDFTESQYSYLFSRLRRLARSPVPLRMRSASNPGGLGHGWVKERFIEPAKRGDRERPFIPARIADNPHLDVAAYRLSLAEMSALDRQRIESGDWDAIETGTLLQRAWFPLVEEYPRQAQLLRYWDLASTEVTARHPDPDWTVGVLMALWEGRYWLVDVQRLRGTPADVDALMAQTAATDGSTVPVRWEEEGGASGKRTTDDLQRRLFVGYDARGIRSEAHKLVRARPLVSAAQAGNVSLVRGPWNAPFLDVVCLVPFGPHDDDLDAAAGALNELASTPQIDLDSIRGVGQRASASATMQHYRA